MSHRCLSLRRGRSARRTPGPNNHPRGRRARVARRRFSWAGVGIGVGLFRSSTSRAHTIQDKSCMTFAHEASLHANDAAHPRKAHALFRHPVSRKVHRSRASSMQGRGMRDRTSTNPVKWTSPRLRALRQGPDAFRAAGKRTSPRGQGPWKECLRKGQPRVVRRLASQWMVRRGPVANRHNEEEAGQAKARAAFSFSSIREGPSNDLLLNAHGFRKPLVCTAPRFTGFGSIPCIRQADSLAT